MFERASEFIKSTLTLLEGHLDTASIEAVEHYLNHSEFEMAFEGLFLEIMQLKDTSSIDFQMAIEVGKDLRLNEESVFDHSFWNKFKKFIQQLPSPH